MTERMGLFEVDPHAAARFGGMAPRTVRATASAAWGTYGWLT